MTPFPNIRHTRNCESTRPLTSRSATNESNEPSSSIVSSSSIVHYHGPKAPPYAPFADRPPPPSYEEACGSGTANTSHQSTSSATNIDTENTNETNNTDAVTASIPDTGNAASIPDTGNAASIPVTANDSNINDVVNESVAIDTPHDEPLINDEDDDEELNDVVIETTAVNAATAESTEIGEVYLWKLGTSDNLSMNIYQSNYLKWRISKNVDLVCYCQNRK